MKIRWTFVKTWNRLSHIGGANNFLISWGWIPGSKYAETCLHLAFSIKIKNLMYGFAIYRIKNIEGLLNEISGSNNKSCDEIL